MRNNNSNNNGCKWHSVNAAKVIATGLILCASIQMCWASAIPIWELLTRSEKMSYLYSTFGQLVSVHCKATAATSAIPVNQCKRDLLAFGHEKLKTFSDSQLDQLEPYQRGANELIWSSVMRDQPSSTTRQPLLTPPDSSILILTHQNVDNRALTTSTISSPQYLRNPLFDNVAENKHKYAMDMDIAHGYRNRPLTNQNHPHTDSFLTGSLVFRVRPDSTPVEEDKHKPLPRDDDLEAYQLSSAVASGGNSAGSGRPKHRRIAMISDLKQKHLASLALQHQLPPSYQPYQRIRRQQKQVNIPTSRAAPLAQAYAPSPFEGFYYGMGQA